MEAVSSLLRKIFTQSIEGGAGDQAPSASPPPRRTGSPRGCVRPARPVSPRQGGPKPPSPGPWRQGSARRPLPGAHAAPRAWSEVPPSQPFSSAKRKARPLCWGPARTCRAGPPAGPADLPQLRPRPDLPGPRPQELRVRWTAVPWPRCPAGARNLWAGPVRSCGLAFPGPRGPAGSTITPSSHCHRACVHTAGRTAPWRQLNTLRAARTPVSARLGWGDGATPPRSTSDMRLERMEATQTPAENCPPRGP